MLTHLHSLWKTAKYADIKIFCHGKGWRVHRSILGSRCAWFSEMMEGLRKVSTKSRTYDTNAKPDTVPSQKDQWYALRIDAFQPDLVRTVLYFIYNGGE